jgi:serine/threonine-protein kinase
MPMITRASLDDDREDREDVVKADTVVDTRSNDEKRAAAKPPEGKAHAARRTGYDPTVTPDSIDPIESDPVPHDEGFALRYVASDLLGEGGMGEVRLARDARIGREVAMKIVRPGQGSRSDLRSRFLREARVQGQLEHPAIVPVYDLGARPDGAAFFTMKRVRGQTLEEILDDLRAKEPAALNEFSRRKLLSAFGSVCLAIDFAHARGVVHRDLKPGNIMLGGFGEVYVLDWGLAKIQNDPNPTSSRDSETVDAPMSIRGQTEAGAVMGTPGYMAPEQLITTEIDARADVYALGAILFEIVVGKPLHDKPKLAQILDSTLTGPETRASIVAPQLDVPPELEAIWTKAVALSKDDRFESARELSDAIERFLDGDRDLEQRKKMAGDHVRRGEAASARALADESEAERKSAMRELGRALALDPSNAQAVRALAELLAEPPAELPDEAKKDLAEAESRNLRVSSRAAFNAYVSWFCFLPLVWLAGFHDTTSLWAMVACIFGAIATTGWFGFSKKVDPRFRYVVVLFSFGAIAFCSRIFGPLMLVPAIALSNTVGFAMTRDHRERVFLACVGLASFLAPFALECIGAISPSYVFEHGRIVIMPQMVSFDHPFWVIVTLITGNVAIIVTAVAYLGAVRDDLARYERHALVQAWHFRQLAPEEARVVAKTEPPPNPGCTIDDARAKREARTG